MSVLGCILHSNLNPTSPANNFRLDFTFNRLESESATKFSSRPRTPIKFAFSQSLWHAHPNEFPHSPAESQCPDPDETAYLRPMFVHEVDDDNFLLPQAPEHRKIFLYKYRRSYGSQFRTKDLIRNCNASRLLKTPTKESTQ